MREHDNERWQVSDLTIDVGAHTVTRDGSQVVLPQLSFRFLLALVRAAPKVMTTDELMEEVWVGVFVNSETVTQRAKLLRDALDEDPKEPRYFAARRGIGYKLLPAPQLVAAAEPDSVGEVKRPLVRRGWGRPQGPVLTGALALGLLSLSGSTAMTALPFGEAAQRISLRVAVLPFDNLSSNPADAYIARGIPEMVLNRLSSVPGLTVIARDSALLGPASTSPPEDAGRVLDAAYVVKGSVQRVGDTLRVTCFVIDAGKGVRLWSERFDWPIDRLYALQDRIADRVATSLQARTQGLGELAPTAITTRNTDAYLAYLKGKSLLGRLTVAETDAAALQFERAAQLDPRFAAALVALFDARMQGAALRLDDLGPVRVRYQPLLDRALLLDPGSGEALFAKAMWSDARLAERIELFRRAAELDPSNSRGLTAYARMLDIHANQSEGAPSKQGKSLLDRVVAIDPLSPEARFWSVQRRWTTIPPERVAQEMARELAIDPQNYQLANNFAFRRWLIGGETADAIEKIERVIASDPQNPVGVNMALAFYLDADDPEAAQAVSATTPATRASSRVLLAQYTGNWREAGTAAFGRGGYLFNQYQSWNWPQAVRDYAVQTGDYDRSARAVAERYGIDLADPRVLSPSQVNGAVALGHILLAKGDRSRGTKVLTHAVQWIDAHPSYGMPVHMRIRASAMMLLGERSEALSNLRASVESGHDIRHWWYVVERDPVWAPVRSDPRFRAVAEMYRQAARAQRGKLDALRRAGKVPRRLTGAER